MSPPPSISNKSYFRGDPNIDISKHIVSVWDLPKSSLQERIIYADVMSRDIGVLHEHVRKYIDSVTKELKPSD